MRRVPKASRLRRLRLGLLERAFQARRRSGYVLFRIEKAQLQNAPARGTHKTQHVIAPAPNSPRITRNTRKGNANEEIVHGKIGLLARRASEGNPQNATRYRASPELSTNHTKYTNEENANLEILHGAAILVGEIASVPQVRGRDLGLIAAIPSG